MNIFDLEIETKIRIYVQVYEFDNLRGVGRDGTADSDTIPNVGADALVLP